MVTGPPRFHNGPNCPGGLFDSPRFDSPSCTHAAVPSGTPPPDWAIDINAKAGDYVYIDIWPLAQAGYPAGGLYRVVAGEIFAWDATANGRYQYFGIHTWNASLGGWENYGWVRIGHFNSFVRPGTVIIAPTTQPAWAAVGRVAPRGGYLEHIHMDFYNERGWSRPYNWDGPTNARDDTWGPPCLPWGGSAPDCNTEIAPNEGIGFIGGRWATSSSFDNPYYAGF